MVEPINPLFGALKRLSSNVQADDQPECRNMAELDAQIDLHKDSLKPKYNPIELPACGYMQLKEEQAVGNLNNDFICMICTEVVC